MKLKTKYKPLNEDHVTWDNNNYERNQWIFKFKNGYGAGVISDKVCGIFSTYGSKKRPFELCVLNFNNDDSYICYDTPITDNVIGYLTEKEVEEYLEKIENL